MKKSGKMPVWAIVLIVIAIVFFVFLTAVMILGVLAYYYFSNDVMTPQAAVVNPPFYLNAQKVNTAGVNLELKNNGGETYIIKSIDISGCGEKLFNSEINRGETKPFSISCPHIKGDNFRGDILITYSKEGSSVEQTSTGSITATIE